VVEVVRSCAADEQGEAAPDVDGAPADRRDHGTPSTRRVTRAHRRHSRIASGSPTRSPEGPLVKTCASSSTWPTGDRLRRSGSTSAVALYGQAAGGLINSQAYSSGCSATSDRPQHQSRPDQVRLPRTDPGARWGT
jgi:hypothetical protein